MIETLQSAVHMLVGHASNHHFYPWIQDFPGSRVIYNKHVGVSTTVPFLSPVRRQVVLKQRWIEMYNSQDKIVRLLAQRLDWTARLSNEGRLCLRASYIPRCPRRRPLARRQCCWPRRCGPWCLAGPARPMTLQWYLEEENNTWSLTVEQIRQIRGTNPNTKEDKKWRGDVKFGLVLINI